MGLYRRKNLRQSPLRWQQLKALSAYVIVLVLASCGVVGGKTAESQCTVPRVCSFLSSHRDPTDRLAGGRSVGPLVLVVFLSNLRILKLILLILILNINLEFYGEGSNLGRTII